jgi:3-dehydroquinate synthase
MQTLNVALAERSYPIHIGAGLLARPDLIVDKLPQKKAVIVTNTTIAPLYLAPFQRALEARGVSTVSVTLPDGESHKNLETLNRIFDTLIEHRVERRTALIALGGGVVGDITGFAAAVYQRGVPYIQVPTTLLAQVDSSVGGKTAINHPLGKNMVGAFYQPLTVISDTDTLATLPPRELAAGLAEVIKYGLIRDRTFFEWLEGNMPRLVRREAEALAHAIERSCINKAEVVATDERESGPRALLNFGHTFGHAIEAGAGYGKWLHGEAVGAGMLLATRLSQRLGLVALEDVKRVSSLLMSAGLSLEPPAFGHQRYLELMSHDKKVADGRIRFVLLERIGEAFVTDQVPNEALAEVLSTGAQHARA